MTLLNRTLVIASLLHAIVIGVGYMSLPPLALSITREGWSLAEVERAWALIPLGSVPAALMTGRLARIAGERILLCLSAIAAAGFFLLRAAPIGYVGYTLALLGFGAATGVMLTLMTVHVSRSVPDRQSGVAQAVFFGAYAFGVAAGLILSEVLLGWLANWRTVQSFWGVLAFLTALLTWFFYPSSNSPELHTGSVSLNREKRMRTLRYCLTYGSYVAAYLALSNILPTRLRLAGWAPGFADKVVSASTITFLLGSAFWASLTDRRGQREGAFRVAMFGAAVATFAIWALMSMPHVVATSSAILILGFFAGGAPLFFAAMLSDISFNSQELLTVAAYSTGASYVGGFVAPFLLATALPSSSIGQAATIGTLFALSALLLPLAKGRRRSRPGRWCRL